MKTQVVRLGLALAAGLVLGAAPPAFAVGTAAGTDISNVATVDYKVAGTSQSTVTSNTVTFKVDRMIDVLVARADGSAVQVGPGATAATGAVTTFTVTNTSNLAAIDYALAASEGSNGDTGPFTGTDNFDVTGGTLKVFVESGVTPGYQPAEDTATYIDELAVGTSKTVYVVGTVPASQVAGDIDILILKATARFNTTGSGSDAFVASPASLGGAVSETSPSAADDPNVIENVFADAAGTATGDGQYDGSHSASSQLNVVTASISLAKSYRVVYDPFNCTPATKDNATPTCATPPKAVPGAYVEYCLAVTNAAGGAAAGSVSVNDPIPANTAFVTNSIYSNATGTGTACDSGGGAGAVAEDDNNSGTDDGPSEAGGDYNQTSTGDVTLTVPSLPANTTEKFVFRVQIQ